MGCCQTTSSIATSNTKSLQSSFGRTSGGANQTSGKNGGQSQVTKKSSIDGQAVLIFFLTQIYFHDIREAILSFISFRDLIRLGSCSKCLYIVAGSKEIIAEFSSRRRTAHEYQVIKGSSSAQLVDDTYYAFTQYAKKHQNSPNTNGSKKKKKHSSKKSKMSASTAKKQNDTALYFQESDGGSQTDLNDKSAADDWIDGDGQRTILPSSQEFQYLGGMENDATRDLIIDENNVQTTPLNNPFTQKNQKPKQKKKHKSGSKKKTSNPQTGYIDGIQGQSSDENNQSDKDPHVGRTFDRSNGTLIKIVALNENEQSPSTGGNNFSEKAKNFTPVKIGGKLLNSRISKNQINPKDGSPMFDPLIDQQCLQIYDSKELKMMEDQSSSNAGVGNIQNSIQNLNNTQGSQSNFYTSQQSKFRQTPQFQAHIFAHSLLSNKQNRQQNFAPNDSLRLSNDSLYQSFFSTKKLNQAKVNGIDTLRSGLNRIDSQDSIHSVFTPAHNFQFNKGKAANPMLMSPSLIHKANAMVSPGLPSFGKPDNKDY